MMNAAPDPMQSLPDDIEALRALVLATMAERDAVTSERDALQQQNDRLRHLLLKLQRMQASAVKTCRPRAPSLQTSSRPQPELATF